MYEAIIHCILHPYSNPRKDITHQVRSPSDVRWLSASIEPQGGLNLLYK